MGVNLRKPDVGEMVRVWYEDKMKYFEGKIEEALDGNDYQIAWIDNRAKKNEVVTLEPEHHTNDEIDKERWNIIGYWNNHS